MQHIFNIAIEVEDERIIQSIEKSVEEKVCKELTQKIEDRICTRSYYGRISDYKPLEGLISSCIKGVIAENKDLILETAAEKLAEKLARSKDGKAILKRFEEVEA